MVLFLLQNPGDLIEATIFFFCRIPGWEPLLSKSCICHQSVTEILFTLNAKVLHAKPYYLSNLLEIVVTTLLPLLLALLVKDDVFTVILRFSFIM
jgi:hypothetical protein